MRLLGFKITRATKTAPSNEKSYLERLFGIGSDNAAGQIVDRDSAMRISTVFSCTRLISKVIGSSTSTLRRSKPDGSKEDAVEQDLYRLLRYQPNPQQTPMEFKEMMQANCILNGNSYAEIDFKGSRMTALYPLDSARMRVLSLPNGDPFYEYYAPDGKKITYKKDEIFHLRAMALSGLVGLSVVQQLADLFGYDMAMTKHANKFFVNAARVGGVLQYPGRLSKQGIDNLRTSWERQYGGVENSHKTAILEQGMTYQNIAMTFEDAQALGQMALTKAQIAGALETPLHLIGDYSGATFSNIEELSLEFITYTMHPWGVRWSEACARCLMTEDEQKVYSVDFDFEPFLRGNALSRANTMNIERNAGVRNADEWRKVVGLNPIEGGAGKMYWQPMNYAKLGEAQQPSNSNGRPGTAPGAQGSGAPDQNKPGLTTKSAYQALSSVMSYELARVIKRESKETESAKKKGVVREPDFEYIRDTLRPIAEQFSIFAEGSDVLEPFYGFVSAFRGLREGENILEAAQREMIQFDIRIKNSIPSLKDL